MAKAQKKQPPTVKSSREEPRSRAQIITADSLATSHPLLKKALEQGTTQIPDPFVGSYLAGNPSYMGPMLAVEPTFPLEELARLALEDVTLASCIEAMAANVCGFGSSLDYIGPDEEQESTASLAEKARIMDLVDRCNPDETLGQVLNKIDLDYNTFGHAYFEVGKDLAGNVDFVYHVPAQTMRVTLAEENAREIKIWLRRNGKLEEKKTRKHFRRFIQCRVRDGTKVYFKEFGDPRKVDMTTGHDFDQIPTGAVSAVAVKVPTPETEAAEVIWLNRYTPGYLYGVPKFISCVAAILGSQEAALTNLDFFKDNAIPALAVLVAGGMLTDDAVSALRDKFAKNKGRRAVHKALILEARATEEDRSVNPMDASPVPRLDIKPLTQERQTDALFSEYTKANSDQVRQSFRLPPLMVGQASDYTRATAEASLDMAEAQVFGPERQLLDDIVNSKLLLLNGKPPMFWRYRSNAPKLSSSDAQSKAMELLEKVGAMTPNRAISIANTLYGLRIPTIKEKWGDLPFGFTSTMVKDKRLSPETGLPETPAPEPDPAMTAGTPGVPGKPAAPVKRPAPVKPKPAAKDLDDAA